MTNPLVTFIVPCYKLAHLLSECVNSILAQNYPNFEVLIMDDCSPDDTSAVARSLSDPRIKYIRNERNLGHLANYNKGIGLSQGKYVWLISADDCLRRPYVLDRYVRLMEQQPNVGYVCCPGIALENGKETDRVQCGYFGPKDRIFRGSEFISTSLRKGYGLLAPSVLVRKDCYDKVSLFPIDMPHQGDRYLWFRWALEYDVAYMCEPMVNYRLHDLNIMKDLVARVPAKVFDDEVSVLWRTREHCESKGLRKLARQCEDALASKYAKAASSAIYCDDYSWGSASYWRLNVEKCNQALRRGTSGALNYRRMRGKFSEYLGNQHWRHHDFAAARRSYASALRDNRRMGQVWLKILILQLGLGRVGMPIKRLTWRAKSYRMLIAERLNRWSGDTRRPADLTRA